MPETTVAAKLPAEPIPGSADIALGIPPIGCAIRAGFGSKSIELMVASSGAVVEKKFFGITVESCKEIEPLVFVNWKVGIEISLLFKCLSNQLRY